MLQDVNGYWSALQNVCLNEHEYIATNPTDSESYKSFELLLNRVEIQNILKQGAATR